MRWCLVALAMMIVACDADPGVMPDAAPLPPDAEEPLAAPTGLVATPGDSQVALQWDAVPGAVRYRVGRADAPGGPRTTIAMPAGTTAMDNGVTNGVTYYYAVQAIDARGDGPWSAEIAARPAEALPLAPTGVTATAGRTKVTLGWQTASDAQTYLVRRATASGGPYGTVAMVAAPPYVDTAVVDNTSYYYVVIAQNTGGDSAPSTEVNARPTDAIPAPAGNVSVLAGKHEVTVAWDAAVAATAYRVERASTQSGPYGFAGLTTGRSLTVASVFSTAWFRVVAVSAAGEGDPSDAVAATPSSFYLYPPYQLRARASRDAASLRWAGDSAQTSFTVLRATTAGGPFTPIATTTRRYYLDAGLAAGTYHYVVRAANGPSANSNELAVEISPAQPARPTGLVVESKGTAVTMNWDPVPGASHYVVRRTHTYLEPEVLAEPVAPTFTTFIDDPEDVYTVSAVVDGIESAGSDEAVPTAVEAFVPPIAARVGAERIVLALPGAQTVTVERADGEAAAYVAKFSGATTAWTDDDVVPGVAYRYRVRAVDATGAAWSPEVPAQLAPARPPYPIGLRVAETGYRWARLAWDAVPGAHEYVVYRGDAFARVGSTAGTELLVEAIDAPTALRVTAVGATGESAPSDPLVVASGASPAFAPAQVRAYAGDAYVLLTWGARDAEGFAIKRATSPGGPYTDVGTAFTANFYDTTVTNDVTYYYVVSAVAGGVETAGPEVSARPSADPLPAPVVTATAGDDAVELAWAAVPGAYQYRIYRGTSAGTASFFTTVQRPLFVDPIAYNGETYHYRIAAMTYTQVEGVSSTEVAATPADGAQPRVAIGVSSSSQEAYVAWSSSPGATAYRIWRAEANDDPLVAIADVTGTSYRDPTPGTHRYAVTAIGPAGESLHSDLATGFVEPGAYPRVDGLAIDTSTGAAIATWLPVGNHARYDLCWRNVTTGAAMTCALVTRPWHASTGWAPGDTIAVTVRVHRESASTVSWAPSVEVTATTTGGAPPTPTVVVHGGNAEAALVWTAVAGATAYRVWRADGPREPFVPIATTTDVWHVATGLRNGVAYSWAVSAIGAGGESNPSAEQIDIPHPGRRRGPAQVVAVGKAGAIAFDAGPTADDVTWEVLEQAAPGDAFASVTPLVRYRGRVVVAAAPGTRAYMLRKCKPSVCSGVRVVTAAPSATAPAAPAAPSDVDVIDGNGEATVLWTPVAGATAYRVYRGPGIHTPGGLAPIAVVTNPPFTDRAIASEIDSVYTVTAIVGGEESAIAPPAVAFPRRDRGWAPAMVTAAAAAGGIEMTWEPSLGATAYQVCRSTPPATTFSCTSATSPYVDTTAVAGTTYAYVVRANGGAYSPAAVATLSAAQGTARAR